MCSTVKHYLTFLQQIHAYSRMFVNNVYSYHLREILSAVRNEYTNWSEASESSLNIRDSLLEALSDGHTAAPLLRLAYLHSRRGATTYLFHLAHQTDSSLRKLVRTNLSCITRYQHIHRHYSTLVLAT